MEHLQDQISKSDFKKIENQIYCEVVHRTYTGVNIWVVAAIAYGFLSFDIFSSANSNITLWENVWPRIIFNALPGLALSLWYRNNKTHTKFKAYSTVITLPLLLLAGCFIHAWNIFETGNYSFYLNFHATNIIVIAATLSLICGPPKLIVFQILGFGLFFFGPLLHLFFANKIDVFKLICNDFLFVSVILYFGLREIYNIRFQLAVSEVLKKNKITPFIGLKVANAIYETKSMDIASYTQSGLIMVIDLRGYTNFRHNTDPSIVKLFMADYHSMTSRILHQNNGFLHKTSGDGILASFGIMEKDEDLSDIPGLNEALKNVASNRKRDQMKKANASFQQLLTEFEHLRSKHKLNVDLLVGAGLAYGAISLLVHGDVQFRQELDIDGEAIVRATRLEAYSKLLNKKVDYDSSFLVISPELEEVAIEISGIKIWLTNSQELAIRDYPAIKSVLYRQWKHNRARTLSSAA